MPINVYKYRNFHQNGSMKGSDVVTHFDTRFSLIISTAFDRDGGEI